MRHSEKMKIDEIQFGLSTDRYERIVGVLSRFPSIDEVIIFGSRALGTYAPASDIDLALKGRNIRHADILKLRGLLDDLPYGYEYDVLDYKNIVLPELKEHIDQFGISFYSKDP